MKTQSGGLSMVSERFTTVIIAVLILTFTVSFPVGADLFINDVDGTWASSSITALAQLGVVEPSEDGTFKPNADITRAQFARMAARAFTPVPVHDSFFTDIDEHPDKQSILAVGRSGAMSGDISGAFHPDRTLSRAEMVTAIVRLIGLDHIQLAKGEPTFEDVPAGHALFDYVEIAAHLDLLPPFVTQVLQPGLQSTRAEAAAMIHGALQLGHTSGVVDGIDAASRAIALHRGSAVRTVSLVRDTIVLRNGNLVHSLSALQPGDVIMIVSDRYDRPRLAAAIGADNYVAHTENDDRRRPRGYVTPGDIRAMISGDWARVGETLKETLSEEITALGVDPDEAEALIERDWDAVLTYSQSHIIVLLSDVLGISQSMARALVDGDWDTVKENIAEEHILDQPVGAWLDALGV